MSIYSEEDINDIEVKAEFYRVEVPVICYDVYTVRAYTPEEAFNNAVSGDYINVSRSDYELTEFDSADVTIEKIHDYNE